MTRSMLFEGWSDVARVGVLGALAHAVMVIGLRMAGKRTLAKLNAFDLVITVALGSVLATIALSSDVALIEGDVASQYSSSRSGPRRGLGWHVVVRRPVRAEATVVFDYGSFDDAALS